VSENLGGETIRKLCELVEKRICNLLGCEHLGTICEAAGCDNYVCKVHEQYCSCCQQRYCEDCHTMHLQACGGSEIDAHDQRVERSLSMETKSGSERTTQTADAKYQEEPRQCEDRTSSSKESRWVDGMPRAVTVEKGEAVYDAATNQH
jgi:hypothetical protein